MSKLKKDSIEAIKEKYNITDDNLDEKVIVNKRKSTRAISYAFSMGTTTIFCVLFGVFVGKKIGGKWETLAPVIGILIGVYFLFSDIYRLITSVTFNEKHEKTKEELLKEAMAKEEYKNRRKSSKED